MRLRFVQCGHHEREVRYCTTLDGFVSSTAWRARDPRLSFAHYLVESFVLDHLVPEYKAFRTKHIDARVAMPRTSEFICNCGY